MPVERVPGFWDYLGEGISSGYEAFKGERDRRTELRHRSEREKVADTQQERQNNAQEASVMSTLFGQGAVDSGTLEGSLRKMGVQGINPGAPMVAPGKAERRRKVLAGGQAAVDALPEDEKADLGFRSAAAAAMEKAQISAAGLEQAKAGIFGKYLSGEKLTDMEYDVTGLPSPSDRELKKLTQMDPYLDQLGGRYVAGVMVKQNGKIKPGTSGQVAEQAYADYVSERAAHGMGGLTPEQVMYTRSYFQKATQNALIAQQKMDVDLYEAESRRIGANAQSAGRTENTALRWFSSLNSAVESVRKAQNDLMRSNPALGPALDNPQLANSPMVKGAMERYLQLEQTLGALRDGQGALADGQVPGNLPALLQAAGQMSTGGAPAAAPGGRGAPPAGGAPAAPAGPPPGPNAITNGDPVERAAAVLAGGQGNLQQLQAAVSQGALTQQQYDAIVKRAQAIQKSQPKR